MSGPVPLVSWDDTDQQWHTARREGCGGSDVTALLGFDRHRSPWQVWAQKTSHPHAPTDNAGDAAQLGHLLEQWLLDQAGPLACSPPEFGEGRPTPHRLYTHPEHAWRRCSPDGWLMIDNAQEREGVGVALVQCKTSGLQTGRPAHGWTPTSIPLGVELQARWEMHVMDAQSNHVVALVVGLGLCHHPLHRDLDVEERLVEQVDQWWQRHVVGGDEPALTGLDTAMVAALYPRPRRRSVTLDDTDALAHWQAYRDAAQDEKDAAERKAEAAVALKALLGDAEIGLVQGRPIASWAARAGLVDYKLMATDLANQLGLVDLPDGEAYRKPPGRSFNIKE